MEPITLTINDAAKSIGIGRGSLYKLINQGRVETVKICGRRLVKVDSLKRLAGADRDAA